MCAFYFHNNFSPGGAELSRSARQMNRKKSSAQEKIASKQAAWFEEEEYHQAG
jgi:hypothetical protein